MLLEKIPTKEVSCGTEMGLILYLLGTHYHLSLVLLGESRVVFLSLGSSDVNVTGKSRSEFHTTLSSECRVSYIRL